MAARIVPEVPGSVERPFSTNSTRRPDRASEWPSIPPPMPVPTTITSHTTRSASRALRSPSANRAPQRVMSNALPGPGRIAILASLCGRPIRSKMLRWPAAASFAPSLRATGSTVSIAPMSAGGAPVRIGILGASRWAPTTFLTPAKENSEIVVSAVASRDASRARDFAAKHGIARAHDSYEALIADPDLDAVYNLLPTSVHGRWTRATLDAGKHVLCEKPFTANAAEAREIAELAAKSDRVVMEALQYRFHPLTARVEQIIASGELGKLERVEVAVCVLLPKRSNANVYDYSLAGGAVMDAGVYTVDMLRTFGGSTPEVVSATAKLDGPQVDRVMTAEVRFANGHTGRLHCALWSSSLFWASAK